MIAPLQIGEKLAQPKVPGLAAPKQSLWSTAPAWRNLTIGSCLLTSLAISAPIVLRHFEAAREAPSTSQVAGSSAPAQPPPQACSLRADRAPQHFTARAFVFVSAEQALAATRGVEAQIGGKVSPGYLSLNHVGLEYYLPTGNRATTMAALPPNMTVRIGDWVEVTSRYRDPSLPCNFIPWTINRILNHAG